VDIDYWNPFFPTSIDFPVRGLLMKFTPEGRDVLEKVISLFEVVKEIRNTPGKRAKRYS